jgi:DNA-binding PadR family transcriptional regulator
VPATPTRHALTSALPIPPEVFHILVALAEAPRHGYGIMLEVERRSGSRVRIQTGPLYRHLKRMLRQGLIEEAPPPVTADSADARRRYYTITRHGRAVAAAEAQRMREALSAAAAARLLTDGAP